MKKVFIVILSAVLICTVFAACSNVSKDQPTTIPTATAAPYEKSTTDTAVIKNGDAAELIKQYSAKELALTDEEKKECSYLTNESGVKIGDDFYISVVAAYKVEEKGEDGKTYVKFDHRGEYYIRYDGKQILRKNIKEENPKEEYTELKVKELKTTKAEDKKD